MISMRLSFILLLLFVTASCNQNMEVVDSGETLENSPMPAPQAPAAGSEAGPFQAGAMDDKVPPFVKAFFMHTWVEALYSPPQNNNPNPKWTSPLADPVNGRVWCTDCHVSGQVDFQRIPKMRMPMTEQFENDKAFMADLMKKWVARLNSDEFFAKAKLKGPVTCLTCHETNPAP
jgi:hypothetical protein